MSQTPDEDERDPTAKREARTNEAFFEGAGGRAPPPAEVAELADACVRFVERAVGVTLDYTADTLSVLDHYVKEAAAAAKGKPEALELAARAVAAYLGEVIRRDHDAWWHAPVGDIDSWQVRFEHVYLFVTPYALACSALGLVDGEAIDAGFVIDEDELEEIAAHLALSPPVPEDEYVLPTTRVDVIRIVADQLKARAEQRGLGDVRFDDADYDA